jgi:hypothetical protein
MASPKKQRSTRSNSGKGTAYLHVEIPERDKRLLDTLGSMAGTTQPETVSACIHETAKARSPEILKAIGA